MVEVNKTGFRHPTELVAKLESLFPRDKPPTFRGKNYPDCLAEIDKVLARVNCTIASDTRLEYEDCNTYTEVVDCNGNEVGSIGLSWDFYKEFPTCNGWFSGRPRLTTDLPD